MIQLDFTPDTLQLTPNGGTASIAIEVGAPGANGGSDESFADYVETPGTLTREAIDARFAALFGADLGTGQYVENITGVTTAATSSGIIIPGAVLFVPASPRDIWIHWAATVGISVAGQGSLVTTLWENTSGFVSHGYDFVRTLTSSPVSAAAGRCKGSTQVGPSTIDRTFYLAISYARENSALDGYAVNGNGVHKTWLTWEAR